ncbi:MAG TPA: hypothetical protein VK936_02510 [Longimicrobiales bacterium]|nr:hypothetical protein [Longimicrobiales bacterium]
MDGAILAAIGVGTVLGGILLATHIRRRGRAAALREHAAHRGWAYRAEVAFDSLPDLKRFELFRPGRNRKLSNVMTSTPGSPRAVVFDYAYTTGGGNSQRRHHQTVFYTTRDDLSLPPFSLRPEHFLHRVAGAFGYQDIDIDGHPEFSRAFLLRGDDPAAVRSAFNHRVTAFLERRPRTCAAGVGRELLYWRPGRRVGTEELAGFVEEGHEIARRFAGEGEGM